MSWGKLLPIFESLFSDVNGIETEQWEHRDVEAPNKCPCPAACASLWRHTCNGYTAKVGTKHGLHTVGWKFSPNSAPFWLKPFPAQNPLCGFVVHCFFCSRFSIQTPCYAAQGMAWRGLVSPVVAVVDGATTTTIGAVATCTPTSATKRFWQRSRPQPAAHTVPIVAASSTRSNPETNRFSPLSAEIEAGVDAIQPALFVPIWAHSDPQVRPLNERSTRRLVLTRADMPQSVQDLHEVVSNDEGEGHDDESIPVFDPDADDDTDSVIDAH